VCDAGSTSKSLWRLVDLRHAGPEAGDHAPRAPPGPGRSGMVISWSACRACRSAAGASSRGRRKPRSSPEIAGIGAATAAGLEAGGAAHAASLPSARFQPKRLCGARAPPKCSDQGDEKGEAGGARGMPLGFGPWLAPGLAGSSVRSWGQERSGTHDGLAVWLRRSARSCCLRWRQRPVHLLGRSRR